MATLLLYADFSPARPWLFATIHANSALLARHNVVLGPFRPWACEMLPSHWAFWTPVPEDSPMPADLLRDGETVRQQLDAGRDVLLMTHAPDRAGHRSLARLLRESVDCSRHAVRCLFVVGRPLCLLEQGYRDAGRYGYELEGEELAAHGAALSLLLEEAASEWGEAAMTLMADTADSPVADRRDDLAAMVFAWLGCPPPVAFDALPRHPLFLSSVEGRRMNLAAEVRNNAWPPLAEGRFMRCLRETERPWGTEPVSPLALRRRLAAEGESDRRALEARLGLSPGALDGPDWLAVMPEARGRADAGEPLISDRIRAFAKAFPADIRQVLRQRYARDACLLNADQKALAEALAAVTEVAGCSHEAADESACGFAVPTDPAPGPLPGSSGLPAGTAGSMAVGDPVPPVELTVLTMTYNHEAYIARCMDSVLAQQTSFPVRHLVLDHDSSDGTPGIIAAYAAKYPSIQPVLLSQRRPEENVLGLFLRCHSPYAAMCDGDDYFCDPLKLQKQVDFLQRHPRCTLCFHPVRIVHEDNSRPDRWYPPLDRLPRGVREEYYLPDLLHGNMIQTSSVVYRWRFREGLPAWFQADLCPGDWYWHLLHAEVGRVGFLPDVMSVYWRHSNALYATTDLSRSEHRRVHGMEELRSYQAINEHFDNRYFLLLGGLANGVLADFWQLEKEEGDGTLFRQACEAFPDFAHYFEQARDVIIKKRGAAPSGSRCD